MLLHHLLFLTVVFTIKFLFVVAQWLEAVTPNHVVSPLKLHRFKHNTVFVWEIHSTCRWTSDFSSSPLYPQLEISEIILKGRNPKEKGKSRRISHTIRVWLAWICLIVQNPRYIVNNYSIAKNKLIYHTKIRKSMERSRFEVYWDLSISSDLHFERDTLVSFWAFSPSGGSLLYFAILTGKK